MSKLLHMNPFKKTFSFCWIALIVCAGLYALLPQHRGLLFTLGSVAAVLAIVHIAIYVYQQIRNWSDVIYDCLARDLGWIDISQFKVHTKELPNYQHVDIFRATNRFCEAAQAAVIESQHYEDLASILNQQYYHMSNGTVTKPTMLPRDVGYKQQQFIPTDQFWVVKPHQDEPTSPAAILRVRFVSHSDQVCLEVASRDTKWAEHAMEQIIRDSHELSIYRFHLLQLSFDPGVKNEYGEVEAGGSVQLQFKQEQAITHEDIILGDDTQEILKRNVFDFHEKADALRRAGIPNKKAMLFYGPPGTGKTYTCKFIYSNLKQITALVVSGQALLHVKSFCNIARMLQPSLVILEDVDLVFQSRENNLYSSVLGELMDELDGFQSNDSVIFLLTTNAIDRLEKAIKDRPGRINQCVYFGPPTSELRTRYLKRYLQDYNCDQLDLPDLVELTDGSSQAYLKELVFRAVQISMEDEDFEAAIRLRNEHFEIAHDEMTSSGEKATGAIIGFRVHHGQNRSNKDTAVRRKAK